MKIVVFVKQVPNTDDVQLDPKTGNLRRDGVAGSNGKTPMAWRRCSLPCSWQEAWYSARSPALPVWSLIPYRTG